MNILDIFVYKFVHTDPILLFLNFMLCICIVGFISSMYMLIRNEFVFKYRTNLLKEGSEINDYSRYDSLPEYLAMFYHFWVWPMSRFEGQKDKYKT